MSSPKAASKEKDDISKFIKTNADWAMRSIVSEHWFENAVGLLSNLNVIIHQGEITGLFCWEWI